ncbi:MAG: hypothetical protein PVF27_08245 [Gemmatimonadales bacterium]|jgi:hypothetical protein
MTASIRRVAYPTILLALVVAPAGTTQDTFVGFGIGTFVGGGRGIASGCHEHSSRTGPSLTVARRVWRDLLALQVTTHVHAFRQRPVCVVSPEPPMDGTYTSIASAKLLESRFATTDLRLRLEGAAGGVRGTVALGGGVAWRAGYDLPYAVVGAGIAAPLGPLWFVAHGELYRVRAAFDLVQQTYVNYELVSVVPLATHPEWSSAGRILVGLLMPVGR